MGLIGSTKSDAQETIRHLASDIEEGRGLRERVAPDAEQQDVLELLESRGVPVTTWSGWELLTAHERALGETEGRERVKVVPREDMTSVSRGIALS